MAEMLEQEFKESDVKFCDNCSYYGWGQPEDRDTILKCAKCKVFEYCSKQCQQEHWMNVHKQHCKYLAHSKILPNSRHEEASCPICKQETVTGKVIMSKSSNPILGCAVNVLGEHEHLAFPLGEMTGKFQTKAEETVSLMQRILLKMKQIKHPAWFRATNLMEELWSMLAGARTRCWSAYVLANPGPRLEKRLESALALSAIKVISVMKKIDDLLTSYKFEDQNEFRHWDVLEILAQFLFMIPFELGRVTTEGLGLPELPEDLLSIRVTSAQYNNLWRNVLDAMSGSLAPFRSLVEVICGGQLWKKCYVCRKKCKVANVVLLNRGHTKFDDTEDPLLMLGLIQASLCGNPMCMQQSMKKILHQDLELGVLYNRMTCESSAFKCDYCAKPGSSGNKGHRCSRCLTKVYCGTECRDLDWKVHKLVCKEGEEERKKKGGKQMRTDKGREKYDDVVSKAEKIQPFLKI